ncbi:hypothetical protein ATANTOWER_027352 [Ataeniobius toweri]|uniref:Uncharacterized protein n=1 Tax=Ataeniobius toweri TaxID=208326 RepID=A0ABU7BIC0_9TELE|nr:hypothetical protein [Ataeniobius toweri]
MQVDPGPSPTTQEYVSVEDHSASSSLTDTNTSLSSSDNDPFSRLDYGTPIGRCTSSSEAIPRRTSEVSESETAKEMVKITNLGLRMSLRSTRQKSRSLTVPGESLSTYWLAI